MLLEPGAQTVMLKLGSSGLVLPITYLDDWLFFFDPPLRNREWNSVWNLSVLQVAPRPVRTFSPIVIFSRSPKIYSAFLHCERQQF